jgi:hypothetical protein
MMQEMEPALETYRPRQISQMAVCRITCIRNLLRTKRRSYLYRQRLNHAENGGATTQTTIIGGQYSSVLINNGGYQYTSSSLLQNVVTNQGYGYLWRQHSTHAQDSEYDEGGFQY